MNEPGFDPSKAHRWFAVELNNRCWDLLEKAVRTEDEDRELVHAAHGACLHWTAIGTPINVVRAECLVANAHAAVGNGSVALRHARRCH